MNNTTTKTTSTRILNPLFVAAAKEMTTRFIVSRVGNNVSTGFINESTEEATHYLLNELNIRGFSATRIVRHLTQIACYADRNSYRFRPFEIIGVINSERVATGNKELPFWTK
mgnify:FL=1